MNAIKLSLSVTVYALFVIMAPVVFAQETHEAGQHTKQEHHGRKKHSDHHVHDFHLAVFGGLTTNMDADHTDFSLGGDLEYRLPIMDRRLGIGILGDVVFAEHTEIILGVPLFFHYGGGFKVFAAPGIAILEHTHVDILGHKHTEKEEEFVVRLGAGYDFHIDNYSITPNVSADFIDGNTSLVYGIALGIGF